MTVSRVAPGKTPSGTVPRPPRTEDLRERANRALKEFYRMQTSLTGLARALTGKPDLRVIPFNGTPHTDGKNIYLRPPIELGDRLRHDDWLCDKRDPATLRQRCEACETREGIHITLMHEIAHNAYESFQPVTVNDKRKFMVDSVRASMVGSALADRIMQRYDAFVNQKGVLTFIQAAALISPYAGKILNAIEDARINAATMRAKPGTRKMYHAQNVRIFNEGIDRGDGKMILWNDAPRNAQMVVGIFVKASGLEYEGWFSPEVQEALDDSVLADLCAKVEFAETAEENYRLVFPILARLKELGFVKDTTDPKPPPPPEPAPEPEPDSEDTGGDSDDEGDSDDDGADGSEEGNEDGDESDDDGGSPDDGDDGAEEPSGEGVPEPDEDDGDPSEDGEDTGGGSGSDLGDDDGAGEPDEGGEGSEDDAELPDPDGDDGESPDGDPGSEADEEEDEDDAGGSGGAGQPDDEEEPDDLEGESDDDSFGGDLGDDDAEGDTGRDEDEDSEDGSDGLGGSGPADDTVGGEGPEAPAGDGGGWGGTGHEDFEEEFDPEVEPEAEEDDTDFVNRAVDTFRGHDPDAEVDDDGNEVKDKTHNEADEENAVDNALVQRDFDKPSANISRVNVHRWDDHVIHPTGEDLTELLWLRFPPRFDREACGMNIDLAPDERLMAGALQHARIVFAENRKWSKEKNLKAGRVNTRALGKRAPLGDERLFQRRNRPGKRDYHVLLGLDVSGSTARGKLRLIKEAALAQADLLHRAGVPFSIYAHSGTGVMSFDSTSYDLCVDIFVVKDIDEPWSHDVKLRLQRLRPVGANLDGHTMEWYRKVLDDVRKRSRVTDTVLMYYTDGAMPAENYEEELGVLIENIEVAKKHGHVVVGVGVGNDEPSKFGLDTVQIDGPGDLRAVVRHLEKYLA